MTQRKRIVHVTYEETFDYDDATYNHATHYDYDIHGNVITLLQDNKTFEGDPDIAWHRFKRMDYIFDLVSGNVHRMDYQTGNADQWHHAYSYDADNRITNVYTTTSTPFSDGLNMEMLQSEPDLSTYWDQEANYQYYDHGPLARTELGEEKVQGIDYAYTLQGWLKGINSNSLEGSKDIGKDGMPNSTNIVAKDVASFSLHYFNGDYSAINASNNNFIATLNSGNLYTNSSTLYNGNIGRMITTITDPNLNASGERDVLAMGNTYRYDQLQRLKRSESFTGLDIANNTWGTSQAGGKYINEFTFDANGNILTQRRQDQNGITIDDLYYNYYNDNGKTLQNRLYHINDASTNSNPEELYDQDYFDPNPANDRYFNNTADDVNLVGNYRYDKEGRLVYDGQEDIANIIWRVDGKVKKIERPLGSTKKNLTFEYDAMGNRIAKHIFDSYDVLEKSTYYILDAQGNTISVYEREMDNLQQNVTFAQSERHIYGYGRLGVLNKVVPMLTSQNQTYSQANWTHTIGERTYEISNHLGNVLSVISDKPIPHVTGGAVDYYMADIRSSQDYSPFGVTLEGRNFTLSGAEDYRYGFNGMQKDDEIKGSGNSYDFGARMYDSRVGRFLSLDPKTASFPFQSSYLYASNCPIFYKDENGEYSVATHYIITYNAAIKAGFSTEFADKIAHYASVYADHPDWNYMGGDMAKLNVAEMIFAGFDPKPLEYNVSKYGSYEKTKHSQASTFISSVTIHAMKTYWETISDEEAVDRALYGGTFEGLNGEIVVIEGALNVLERYSSMNMAEGDWTEAQMKEFGIALHTIQDAKVHQGARWVTPQVEDKAEELEHSNEHPDWGCVVNKTNVDEAIKATGTAFERIKQVVSTVVSGK